MARALGIWPAPGNPLLAPLLVLLGEHGAKTRPQSEEVLGGGAGPQRGGGPARTLLALGPGLPEAALSGRGWALSTCPLGASGTKDGALRLGPREAQGPGHPPGVWKTEQRGPSGRTGPPHRALGPPQETAEHGAHAP